MTQEPTNLACGVDHVAYPTFDPAATVRFYNEVLGFPIVHAVCAKGWGVNEHPDFVHFFFDVGHGDRLAFFYYFGLDRYEDSAPWLLRHSGRHLAIHVESPAVLGEYERRLAGSTWPSHMRVVHETIESIYVVDPNDYLIEFTCATRPIGPADVDEAELSVRALVDIVSGGDEPTLAALWERKAELIDAKVQG
jgi:catechol 2,3-dioxygenase-like lactoylglutathione lyase family enzyme